jgi:cytochrome c oxidase accessory protein FixG
MTIRGIQPWRRLTGLAEAVIIIGLPFLRINGESALRFDIPTLRLHLFGISLWMDEFYTVLIATIFVATLFIFLTIMFGRIWCGWVCPQTVLSDMTSFIERDRGPLSCLLLFMISTLVAANLIWYFVSPYDFFPLLIRGELARVTWIFWSVLTIIIFLNLLLLRYRFCATICPYARLQGTLFDDRTLVIAFDEQRRNECMGCMACVRVCPVGIDIRDGLAVECTACARCIDRCAEMMGQRDRGSLINYSFGLPGRKGGLVRQNIILIGSVTLIFFAYLIYLLLSRPLVDMTVLPNPTFQSGPLAERKMLNSYILSIRNRSKDDVELTLKARGLNGRIEMRPEGLIRIRAEEVKRIPVYIKASGVSARHVDVEISIESMDHKMRARKRIRVMVR